MNRWILGLVVVALCSGPAALDAQEAPGTWSIGGDFTLGGAYPAEANGGCGTQYPYGVGIRAGYGPASWARVEGEIRWFTGTQTAAVCDDYPRTVGQGAHLTPLGIRFAVEPGLEGSSQFGFRASVGAGAVLDRSNPYVSLSGGIRIGSRSERAVLLLEYERMTFQTDLYTQVQDQDSGDVRNEDFRTVWAGMNLLRLTVDLQLFR
jgi:hypothetical protein